MRLKGQRSWTWDDLRFPVTGINPPGAVADPSVENTTGTMLFSATLVNTVAIISQMPHGWREGSAITPHVHWAKTTSAGGNVTWQMQYRISNNNSIMPAVYQTATTSSAVAGTPDTNEAEKMLISSFGPISMTGYKISSFIHILLSRLGDDVADTYGAVARLWEFDIHYQSDTRGSVAEFTKY